MSRLIRFELRKLFRMKSLYICGILCMVMVALSNHLGLTLISAGESADFTGISAMIDAMENSNIDIFMAILISLVVCVDYTEGMAKTIVGRGYSRVKYFLSKYMISIVCVLIFCVAVWVTGFAFGTIRVGVGSGLSLKVFGLLGAQFLIILANSSIVFFLAMLFRKTAGAIAGGIILPGLVSTALFAVDNLMKLPIKFSGLWVSGYLADVSHISAKVGTMGKTAVVSLIYVIVLATVSYLSTMKRDV